jgi:hypothetical protein
MVLTVVACGETPLAPSAPQHPSTTVPALAQSQEPKAKISARSSRDRVEMWVRQGGGDFELVVGDFDAQISARGTKDVGRIRMEWGGDSRRGDSGVLVDIRLETVSIVSGDVVEFTGMGTRTDRDTGRAQQFRVSGTATQDTIDPDDVIFDIVGSGVHSAVVELPGRFVVS